MPVWLDAIPDEAPRVVRPAMSRWLIFLLVMLVTVIVVGAWFWQGPREGIVFWLTLIVLPICCWGLLFCLRRFAYKTEQVGAASWNRERAALIRRETLRGQQPAWILGSRIEMRAGQDAESVNDTLHRAIPVLEALPHSAYSPPVHYAALPHYAAADSVERSDFIGPVTAWVADVLAPLREDLHYWLQIDSELLEEAETCMAIIRQLEAQTGRVFSRINLQGMAGFDSWLDGAADSPSVLVSVAVHLPSHREEGGADAITMMVLANRPSEYYPDALRLHRPEQGSANTLDVTLERALLWANVGADKLSGGWMTGQTVTQGSAWNGALESCGATFSLTDALHTPDYTAGYAGVAAPWVCIALTLPTLSSGQSLAIASQTPDEKAIWVVVVKHAPKEEGITGNV